MKTKFFVYSVGNKFIRIRKLKFSLSTILDCAYWEKKSDCESWEKSIKNKYPDAKIVEAYLTTNKP